MTLVPDPACRTFLVLYRTCSAWISWFLTMIIMIIALKARILVKCMITSPFSYCLFCKTSQVTSPALEEPVIKCAFLCFFVIGACMDFSIVYCHLQNFCTLNLCFSILTAVDNSDLLHCCKQSVTVCESVFMAVAIYGHA